jgi:hypothetical protein
VLSVVGRAGWGTATAFSSRYTPFAILGIISLYCLILSLFHFLSQNGQKEKKYSFLFGSIIVLITIGLILGNVQGYKQFDSRNVLGIPNDNLLNNRYYLSTYQNQSNENLTFIFPDPQQLRTYFMEKYRLHIFYNNSTLEKISKKPPDNLVY